MLCVYVTTHADVCPLRTCQFGIALEVLKIGVEETTKPLLPFFGEWREAAMVAAICDWRINLFLLVLLRAGSTMAFVPAVAGI